NRGSPAINGQLSPPNGQVFDEVYFPVDAYDDVKGIEQCKPTTVLCKFNYFDPEPPLSKEIIAAGELGYGWYRAHFQGATGDYIDLGFNTFGWRIAACIFGTLCIPMMYLFARRLWPNRLFAIAAATLACFDGMFFIQSRIGMIDIFPIFFILAAYFLFLVHMQSRSSSLSLLSLVALGTVLGIGIASKWIVLGAWASIVFFLVVRLALHAFKIDWGPPLFTSSGWFLPRYMAVGLLALVVVPLGIYLLSWYPFFARGQFHNLTDLINYQLESFNYHKNLVATHPYGSPAWSWPFLARPVLYYAQYDALGNAVLTGRGASRDGGLLLRLLLSGLDRGTDLELSLVRRLRHTALGAEDVACQLPRLARVAAADLLLELIAGLFLAASAVAGFGITYLSGVAFTLEERIVFG